MTPQDKIKAVEAWQTGSKFHPLTCGNNSYHKNLIPKIVDNVDVILVCKDCDYVQLWVPDVVYKWYSMFPDNYF